MEINHPISFWQAIIEADYVLPAGDTVATLTPELLRALGSTDPVLRDEIALSILAEWLAKPGYYTHNELRSIAAHMGENLRVGIGETGSDTVFLRSFSALVLDCVIDYDNNHPFLREAEVFMMLDQSIAYLRDERDLRGYVAEKGWAHATAHTADLLTYLVRSPHLRQAELERVFQGIAARVSQPVEDTYLYREDERLALTVMAALHRDILAIDFLENWCEQLAHPVGEVPWFRATTEFPLACAYQNAVQFVRSLYFQLRSLARAHQHFLPMISITSSRLPCATYCCHDSNAPFARWLAGFTHRRTPMTQLDNPHGPVAIRTAREDDAEAYRDLRIEALRTVPTAFGSDVASAEARTLEQWRQQMRGSTGEGDTLTGVAEAAGALVAMTTFVQETGSKLQHQANIYGVYVHPDWRSVGILDALVAQGTAWAKQRNVRLLKLSVSANNTAAMRAYTRLGFQVYGIDPEAVLWEGVFYDELLMYRRVER